MHLAAIALGSNLDSQWGDRRGNLLEAIERLSRLGDVEATSSFFDTEPVGYLDQPRFLNAALLLRTDLEPLELIQGMMAIELAMGRQRIIAKGPRVVDLDLLLFDDVTMDSPILTLPHPAMHERRFVLEPLAEIAADAPHPVRKQTIRELRDALPPGQAVRKTNA
jgi:2-amino-4-hydroxy-6-hydroxymethyldihydropteridine diphosphokinase